MNLTFNSFAGSVVAADRLFSPSCGYRPFGKPAVMNRFSRQRGGVVRTHAADLKYYALA